MKLVVDFRFENLDSEKWCYAPWEAAGSLTSSGLKYRIIIHPKLRPDAWLNPLLFSKSFVLYFVLLRRPYA
jgi:hypothetical protein